MFPPNDDVEAIIEVLEAHRVHYLLIGGIAGVLFGSPYPTYDIDICADQRPSNRASLAAALQELEANEWDPRKDEFVPRDWNQDTLTVDKTWLLQTKYGRLDVLFNPTGTQGFQDLNRRRELLDVSGRKVPVAALEDLIRMKEAAGRARDLEHLPTLRKLLEEWLRQRARG